MWLFEVYRSLKRIYY